MGFASVVKNKANSLELHFFLLSLQRETPPSAKALALFCYPPYCKVGFFVPFWGYFGTFLLFEALFVEAEK